LVYITPFVEIT